MYFNINIFGYVTGAIPVQPDHYAAAQLTAQRPTEPEIEYLPHPQQMYTSTITVMPPTSFKPIPIHQQQDTPQPQPPTVPPKPFKDTSIFQNVDTHAVEVIIPTSLPTLRYWIKYYAKV